MKLESIDVSGYRNLTDTVIQPQGGMNVFYGDNAHGKTNFLESIWMLTGGKSFRGSKDSELVAFGKEKAVVRSVIESGKRKLNVELHIGKRRQAVLNGLTLESVKRLTGRFCAVIFSPDHLMLIKEGPEGRRRFVDAACCQLRPAYMSVLAEYNRALTQRNTLIRSIKLGHESCNDVLMDTFDERVAASGIRVREYRNRYIRELAPHAEAIYDGLSRHREHLKLRYEPQEMTADRLFAALKERRSYDLKAGFTTVGPHRDDIDIDIGDRSARAFASQGQQRSAVLSLKLAESALLSACYGENPVILLDDVMSELDVTRQEYILNHIDGFQVFITCCDPAAIKPLADGNIYRIENGQVIETR